VGVQEVRWEKGGTERAKDYTLFYGEGNEDYQLRIGFFVHAIIISAVRKVPFISYRMLYTGLKCCWCNIIVLSEHAPCEDISVDLKDSFSEELGRVFSVS
jgi:hypothetical protein